MRFSEDWSEDHTLADGRRVRLRLIRSSDKDRLLAGFSRLSPESRYLRFFAAKPRLSHAELEYFTEIDGYDHFALGAVELVGDDQEGDGVAIARFVRLPEDASVAEPAIVVTDEYQCQGLGRLLLGLLVEAALERDVTAFRAEFLATNNAIEHLLTEISPEPHYRREGAYVHAELPLIASDEPSRTGPLDVLLAWMRLVAGEVLELQRRFSLFVHPQRHERHEHDDGDHE